MLRFAFVSGQHKYSYAIVDGHLEKVGNYNVEPPGLFRGRGKHPKTGKLKARVMPSDIALNCAEPVCVPRCNVPGYAWQNVQHSPWVRREGIGGGGGGKRWLLQRLVVALLAVRLLTSCAQMGRREAKGVPFIVFFYGLACVLGTPDVLVVMSIGRTERARRGKRCGG